MIYTLVMEYVDGLRILWSATIEFFLAKITHEITHFQLFCWCYKFFVLVVAINFLFEVRLKLCKSFRVYIYFNNELEFISKLEFIFTRRLHFMPVDMNVGSVKWKFIVFDC